MKRAYEFTLKFAVPVRTAEPDDWIDTLAEAGCDVALIGTGISWTVLSGAGLARTGFLAPELKQ